MEDALDRNLQRFVSLLPVFMRGIMVLDGSRVSFRLCQCYLICPRSKDGYRLGHVLFRMQFLRKRYM